MNNKLYRPLRKKIRKQFKDKGIKVYFRKRRSTLERIWLYVSKEKSVTIDFSFVEYRVAYKTISSSIYIESITVIPPRLLNCRCYDFKIQDIDGADALAFLLKASQ